MAPFLAHHHAEAEDMTQETPLKAIRALNSFQPGTGAAAWLGTIKSRTHRGRAMLRDVLLPKAKDLEFLPRDLKVNSGSRSEVKP